MNEQSPQHDSTATGWTEFSIIPAGIVGTLAAAGVFCAALIFSITPTEAALLAALAGALSLGSAIAPWWTAGVLWRRLEAWRSRDL